MVRDPKGGELSREGWPGRRSGRKGRKNGEVGVRIEARGDEPVRPHQHGANSVALGPGLERRVGADVIRGSRILCAPIEAQEASPETVEDLEIVRRHLRHRIDASSENQPLVAVRCVSKSAR